MVVVCRTQNVYVEPQSISALIFKGKGETFLSYFIDPSLTRNNLYTNSRSTHLNSHKYRNYFKLKQKFVGSVSCVEQMNNLRLQPEFFRKSNKFKTVYLSQIDRWLYYLEK